MSKIALNSNASGTGVFTIASPNSDTDRTLTLPDSSGDFVLSSSGVISDFTSTGIDDNATSTAITIDASENVLVSDTTANPSGDNVDSGIALHNAGLVRVSTNNAVAALDLNVKGRDGAIATFRKDGTAVGSIGSVYLGATNSIFITSETGVGLQVGWKFDADANQIVPCQSSGADRDNAVDLGSSSNRMDDIYATNGTIQTSDANEKQDIEALLEAETRVAVAAKGLLRKFRWKSAVEEKGDDARIHFGIIAQDLQAAFEAEGLDAGRYGMFIHSTWTDEETGEERSRMGVRYSELLAFIIAAI